MPSLELSARSRALPASHRPEHYATHSSLLALPCNGPRKKKPRFKGDRLDALATCHLEGLRIREGGVLSTQSALEATASQEDLVVSRSKLDELLSYASCIDRKQQSTYHND